MVKALALSAFLLAFEMPAFHLVWVENGQVVQSPEDLTLTECKERANHYRKRAQAVCVLDVGFREYT